MKLKRSTVQILIMVMTLALGGIVYLQIRLFLANIALRQETFKGNVLGAMNYASSKLEESDLRERFLTVQANPAPVFYRKNTDSGHTATFFTTVEKTWSAKVENGKLSYNLERPQHMSIKLFDALGRLDTVLVEAMATPGVHVLMLPKMKAGTHFVRMISDSASSVFRWEGNQAVGFSVNNGNEDSLQNVVLRVAETFKTRSGVMRPINMGILDSALTEGLSRTEIHLPYSFAVLRLENDSLLAGDGSILAAGRNQFTIPLFADNFSGQPARLAVSFPTYRANLLQEYLPEFALNLLLLGIVVACFWVAVRTLVRQHEFAGRMSDFINNMTHEFKTPLSTIALAREALDRPDVFRSRPKFRRYTRIIEEEYGRMRSQVEKILDMAALEEGEVEFHRASVNVHDLLKRVTDHLSLQLQAKGGTVSTDFEAIRPVIPADSLHLENVLRSVLDNAMKYSAEPPHIIIHTLSEPGWLVVAISDRGIGIAKEHLARVFDKYYRVPKGNVHDVKGFGLGLSYAKLVVEAHGGTIVMESTPGSGSTVTIRLPEAAS